MKKRILVVEDEQMLAKIIEIKLAEEEYTVEHAYDGEEAYEMLSKQPLPDLVLLDILLPKMSGFDVLEKLKSESKPLPKVIVFSNFAQRSDVERAKSLGAIDYIVKAAFSPAEILDKINAIFQAGEPSASSSRPTSVSSSSVSAPVTPPSPYDSFASLEDVKPMSEVLHPGGPNLNS